MCFLLFFFLFSLFLFFRFPSSSAGKESACKAVDLGSILELGRSPGERNGNPLQYLCLENSMDSRAWQTTVHGVAKSRTQLRDEHLAEIGLGFHLMDV